MDKSHPALTTELIVIGESLTSLGIAWDACLRGIKTVILSTKPNGFAPGQSAHLHSGAYYTLSNPQLARHCAQESIILSKLAPAAVEVTGGFQVACPGDPLDYADTWFDSAKENLLTVEELSTTLLLKQEPHLNPRISRAFRVADASLDLLQLTSMLRAGILQAGGKFLRNIQHYKVHTKDNRLTHLTIQEQSKNGLINLGAEHFIITGLDDIHQFKYSTEPIPACQVNTLFMSDRYCEAVIRRCNGSAALTSIVPLGPYSLLYQITYPKDALNGNQINLSEIELLLSEADILVPDIVSRKPQLYTSTLSSLANPSLVPGQIGSVKDQILDERNQNGLENLVIAFDGEATIFRLIAEKAVDIISRRVGSSSPCTTKVMELPQFEYNTPFFVLNYKDPEIGQESEQVEILCDCSKKDVRRIAQCLHAPACGSVANFWDLGLLANACALAFCEHRLSEYWERSDYQPDHILVSPSKPWDLIHLLGWGSSLSHIELMRRVRYELLNLQESS
jgi:glycerol-3-phosphate dehydrogenase